jgi:hypothetical protein
MGLLNEQDWTVEVKLYFEEVVTKYGYKKIVVWDDEEAETELNKKEKYEEKRRKKAESEVKIDPVDGDEKVVSQPDIEEKTFPNIQCVRTLWKSISWREQNDITEKASYYNQNEAMQDLNVWKFRDLRLKTCLVKWDLKDETGAEIPLTPQNVDRLPSDVVMTLLSKYENMISISAEEAKN